MYLAGVPILVPLVYLFMYLQTDELSTTEHCQPDQLSSLPYTHKALVQFVPKDATKATTEQGTHGLTFDIHIVNSYAILT